MMALLKLSMLFFFLRVFPTQSIRRTTYAIIVIVLATSIVSLLLSVFICWPVNFFWEGWIDPQGFGEHRCSDFKVIAYIGGGFSILHEVLILAIPIPVIYNLNASKRSKIAISFMFGLGVFVLVTSCVRLRYVVLLSNSLNPTWDYVDAMIWSGLEVSISMIVTSLPAIRLLARRIFPNFFITISNTLSGSRRFKSSSAKDGATIKSRATRNSTLRSRAYSHGVGVGSDLELGDRLQGEVQTEVGVSKGETSSTERLNHPGMETGIYVSTTTTVDRRTKILEPNSISGALLPETHLAIFVSPDFTKF
jgi:hypothetical protein